MYFYLFRLSFPPLFVPVQWQFAKSTKNKCKVSKSDFLFTLASSRSCVSGKQDEPVQCAVYFWFTPRFHRPARRRVAVLKLIGLKPLFFAFLDTLGFEM